MPRRRYHLLLALSALLASPVFAQTAASADSGVPAPTLRVNARSVVVDVVVTDKNNKAVTGLPREDFQVFEDGKPQTITFFEQHAGAATAAALTRPAPPLPPNTFTNVPPAPLADSVNVLLMDALNTPMADQVFVHKEMVRYLGTIPPGIRIAVFLLSTRLRIVQGFTEDSSALRAAIARTAANPTQSPLMATPAENDMNHTAVDQIASTGPAGNAQAALSASALLQFLNEQSNFLSNVRSDWTLQALQQLAQYLAAVPGRKNLVWFTSTVPLCLFAKQSLDCPYYDEAKKTVSMLADAQVSLYPIEASGLTGGFDGGDASVAPRQLTSKREATLAYSKTRYAASLDRGTNQLAMDQLARDTGGKATYNGNDLSESLAEDIDNGARYYTLAYTPTNMSEAGRERKIEVKVAPGKFNLAYRRSYIEDTPKEQKAAAAAKIKDPLRLLMDRGMPNFNGLRYQMHVAPASPQPAADAAPAGSNAALKAPFTRYGVDFALSMDGLDLIPGPDGVRLGKIEIALVAYSHDGKALNWDVHFVGLAVRPEQYAEAQKSGIPLHLDLNVPPGDVYLRSGIYDTFSSKAGTLEIPLNAVVAAAQ
jgi:VWFA-related protein